MTFLERLRALVWFLLAAAWFLFSDLIAARAAGGLTAGDLEEPLYRILLLFLLIVGYWVMSRLGQRRMDAGHSDGARPAARLGRRIRPRGRAGLGQRRRLRCCLPRSSASLVVAAFHRRASVLRRRVLDLVALAAGALAVEIAFRGYPFLRLVEAIGSRAGRVLHGRWSMPSGAHTPRPPLQPRCWFRFFWD